MNNNTKTYILSFIALLVICLVFIYLGTSLFEISPVLNWHSLKLSFLIIITLYIPLSAIAYCKYRRNIRHYQLKHYLGNLGFKDEKPDELINTFAHDASLNSHNNDDVKNKERKKHEKHNGFIPAFLRLSISVSLATSMAFLGMSALFYSDKITKELNKPNLFLGGMEAVNYINSNIKLDCIKIYENLKEECKKENAENHKGCGEINNINLKSYCEEKRDADLKRYQTGALLMIGMASLGAVIWGLQHIIMRYILFDINSGVYYTMAIRIITASVVAVVIYHSFDAITDGVYTLLTDSSISGAEKGDKLSSIFISIAFFIGMFPQRGMLWLKENVKIFADEDNPTVKKLPLSMLQGVTQHDIVRLSEISIENCYMLADQCVVRLLLLTPYTPNVIINLIAQAKLCVYFPDAMDELRSISIKNIFDIYNQVYVHDEKAKWPFRKKTTEEEAKEFEKFIVEETKVKLSHIKNVVDEIGHDLSVAELYSHYNRLYRHERKNKTIE